MKWASPTDVAVAPETCAARSETLDAGSGCRYNFWRRFHNFDGAPKAKQLHRDYPERRGKGDVDADQYLGNPVEILRVAHAALQ